jgi:hypothetical protein
MSEPIHPARRTFKIILWSLMAWLILIMVLMILNYFTEICLMLIKVFCNGNGNHMIRKRIFPFHYDGRVLLRCELCDLDFVTSEERWQLAEETITSHSVDLYLEDIHAARLRHPSRN